VNTVLRNALVVDGSGAPGQRVDVGIEGGRIAAIGDIDAGSAKVIDLDGLVLAPGFIDVHTHLDAQVLWDADVTPCSWYGVTTVVVGNCGFGIAPTRPEHRGEVGRIMESVEDMSYECLAEGVPWAAFETYPQYLDALEKAPKRLNVASMIGHTPVRLYVLGDDADQRTEVSDDELKQMRAIVDEALEAGAVGFATSRFPTANGRYGRPVPSRWATADELYYLASALRDAGHGVLMTAMGPDMNPPDLARISAEWNVPSTYATYSPKPGGEEADDLVAIRDLNAPVFPQFLSRGMTAQLNFHKPFFFGSLPSFHEVLKAPFDQRAAIYTDPAWRAKASPEIEERYGKLLRDGTIVLNETHPDLEGRNIGELVAERGGNLLDTVVQIALEDNLETRFQVQYEKPDSWIVKTMNVDIETIIGLGDAGAHSVQLADASQPVSILAHFVRDTGAVTLEHAIWRLARQPAELYGFDDRGRIEVGAVADLVAFDLATVGVGERERAFDLPAGAERLVVKATGIEHIWVNGVAVRHDGKDITGEWPGTLIRSQAPHRAPGTWRTVKLDQS
jgi:N-acyl-D-amino-acid deacylase